MASPKRRSIRRRPRWMATVAYRIIAVPVRRPMSPAPRPTMEFTPPASMTTFAASRSPVSVSTPRIAPDSSMTPVTEQPVRTSAPAARARAVCHASKRSRRIESRRMPRSGISWMTVVRPSVTRWVRIERISRSTGPSSR